jgi:hypothetical protein
MSFKRTQGPGGGATAAVPSRPAGVRTSTSGVAMTSSGAAGMDAALGGGLPLGSLALLVEDAPTTHHDALARLFLAQGLAHGHAVALAQQHVPPADTLAALPAAGGFAPVGGAVQRGGGGGGGDGLSIAWRYAQQGKGAAGVASSSSAAAMYRHAFDLSEAVSPAADAPVSHLGLGRSSSLSVLLEDVRAHVRSARKRGLLARVAVCGLCSELWDVDTVSLQRFLHLLRVIVQRADAVAVVSVPRYAVYPKLLREADIVMRLDTFEGKGAGEAGLGSEWLGVLRIEKSYVVPGAVIFAQRRVDMWVFKRGRRRYVFEVAAAAPDVDEPPSKALSESPADAVAATAGGAGSLCAPGPQQNKYEF